MSLCKSYIFKSINPQSSNLKRATAQLLLLRFFKCRLAAPIPYQQVINKFTTKKIQKYRSSIKGIRKVIVNCLLSLKQTIRKPPITNTPSHTNRRHFLHLMELFQRLLSLLFLLCLLMVPITFES